MKVLVHTCCGPCLIYPLKVLREQGHEVFSYFYNPNIHPYSEYLKRLDALKSLCEKEKFSLKEGDYDFYHYFHEILLRENRCQGCYRLRLSKAAEVAKKEGFAAFTTTLLVSPHQKHQNIKEIGEKIAQSHNITFLYQDFRPGYQETVKGSKARGLYRQKYCGCLYSEMECRKKTLLGAKI